MSCEGSTVEVKYKVDCTNVSALLENYMIDQNSFEVVHKAACIFFNALAETISASVQKEVITMISEILGLPFPGEETVQGYEGSTTGTLPSIKAMKALKVSPTASIGEIEKAFEIAKKAIIEKKDPTPVPPDKEKEIEELKGYKGAFIEYFNSNNIADDKSKNEVKNQTYTKTYQAFIDGVKKMAPDIYADGINSKYVIDVKKAAEDAENKYSKAVNDHNSIQHKDKASNKCPPIERKGGGKKRSRKKRRMKHLRKTQKGGFSDKDLEELVIPHFFWQMVKEPLREQLTVVMDELMNCEKLKMYIVRSVWDNELENIVMKDAIGILQEKAKIAVENQEQGSNVVTQNTKEEENIIIKNMVLLKE